jgi:hypothetical protein
VPQDFEIVGGIEVVETIATGNAIREIAELIDEFGAGRWRNSKASHSFAFPTSRCGWLRSTGMKLMESENEDQDQALPRLKSPWTNQAASQSASKTTTTSGT